MTRFHLSTIAAAILGALALAAGRPGLLGTVLAALGVAIGFGVVLPHWRFFGPFLCHGVRSQKVAALTFDDGPDPSSTPALLDLLRDAGVPAAFFCIGERVAAHPELAARMVREGHLVGNHSYAHSHWTNFFSSSRLRSELRRTQETIARATGTAPRWFRPPMGLSNPRVFRAARELGLVVVGWSARGFDTQIADPARIVNRIARRLEPGAIVLLHDGRIPADRLLVTVKTLLDTARTRGYEWERLDRLLT